MLTYDWTKNGEQVTGAVSALDRFLRRATWGVRMASTLAFRPRAVASFQRGGFRLEGYLDEVSSSKGVHYMGLRRLSVDRARNYYTFTTLPLLTRSCSECKSSEPLETTKVRMVPAVGLEPTT